MSPLVLLALILFVFVIGWVVRAAVGRAGRRAMAVRRGGAVCGNCGYAAALREADVCPECGQRYEHAGVLTRALAVRLGPPLWIAAAALLPVALVLAGFAAWGGTALHDSIAHGGSRLGTVEHRFHISPSFGPPGQQAQPPDYEFAITHRGTVSGGHSNSMPFTGAITLEVRGPAVTDHEAVYDIDAGTWTLRDPSTNAVLHRGMNLADAATALYARSGADALWPGSQQELQDAQTLAANAEHNTQFANRLSQSATSYGLGGGSGSSSSYSSGVSGTQGGTRLAATLGAGAIPIVAFAVALVLIHRARRRAMTPS